MENKIELVSRYHTVTTLEKTDKDTIYKVIFEDNNYIRVGKHDNGYVFIDPPGGPMISVGMKIEDMTIKRIYAVDNDGFYIEF